MKNYHRIKSWNKVCIIIPWYHAMQNTCTAKSESSGSTIRKSHVLIFGTLEEQGGQATLTLQESSPRGSAV